MNIYNLTGKELQERIKSDMAKMYKVICVDFDGVIHPYTKGWVGLTPDVEAPVKGVREELEALKEQKFRIVVFTTRAQTAEGVEAVKKYLELWRVPFDDITAQKVGAHCYIDDRSIRFNGKGKGLADKVINFKPWLQQAERVIDIPLTENQIDKVKLILSEYLMTKYAIRVELTEEEKACLNEVGDIVSMLQNALL